jgi:hypothetical protein
VVWREASQLVRLPVLSFLAGGEAESRRLAPLTDLFTARVLAAPSAPRGSGHVITTRPVIMPPPVVLAAPTPATPSFNAVSCDEECYVVG